MGVTNVPTPGVPDNYEYYQFTNFATGNLSFYNPKIGISEVGPWPITSSAATPTVRRVAGTSISASTRTPGSPRKPLSSFGSRCTMRSTTPTSCVNLADAEVENPSVDGYFNGNRNLQLGAKVIF